MRHVSFGSSCTCAPTLSQPCYSYYCQRDQLLSSSSSSLRRIRRSLDADSAATLVHTFATSRVDYCNAILAAAPKTITDRLQRVLNAAAGVISDTKKFDQGLSRLMHQELHWLGIPERVNYKLGVLTHRCLLGKAPVYLSNCCIPVSQVARHQLTVPRHRLSTYGRRAFAVAGPTMFNTLPDIYEILQSTPSDSR